jgi:hypothetical protein
MKDNLIDKDIETLFEEAEQGICSNVNAHIKPSTFHMPKTVAHVTLCGAIHFHINDSMGFIRPTPEQIKNLKERFCIDVELIE